MDSEEHQAEGDSTHCPPLPFPLPSLLKRGRCPQEKAQGDTSYSVYGKMAKERAADKERAAAAADGSQWDGLDDGAPALSSLLRSELSHYLTISLFLPACLPALICSVR